MADNQDKPATRREEQQNLTSQQKDLFEELSREQVEAERALRDDQEESEEANSPEKME